MFRQEQRFSFRKYSFGLASALIANVVFGATIAGGPVVHANTETEAATVTSTSNVQSETVGSTEPSVAEETVATPVVRNVSLTYTVKVVDKEGAVLRTEVKTVDATTGEEVASVLAELGEDLVPTDYKLIAGLGQVRVVENQDNVFTVTVEKVVAKQISETPTATASETAISSEVSVTETSETAISSEVSSTEISLASSEAPVEVIASSETSVAPAIVKVTESVATNTSNLSSLALLAYEVHYTDTEGQVVGKTAGLVTAESKDGVATKQVNFTATDVPAGYELAPGQSQVLTKQLVENQINILSFAVVKKSEEEEIAESQLAHKDVLEQVTSEADLLANEALRQVATSQAGNTTLETAATTTKEVVAEAKGVLKDASATQETVDAQVETVKASTKALADEMLKVDEDGVLTAQLAVSSTNSATVSTNATYNVSFYEDMHSRVPDFVRVSNISVSGQTITYEIIFNESNSSGYGKAYHEFALGNEVDTTSVTIVRQQRSDSTSAWVNDGSWNAGTWVGGERQYFSRSNGNILGALYPYNNARDNTTGAEVDAANINAQVGTLYRDQLDVTTRAYRYIITATARDGKNPANMAFMAGFRAGTDNRAYYVATPGVTDPVGPEFKNTNSDRTTTPKDVYIWKDTPMRTEADLSVVTNGVTINEIYFVEDETTTRTGDGLTVSTEGKVSGQTNLSVGTHNVDSIINYDNSSEVRSGDRFWIAVMDAVKTADVTKSLGDTYDANSLATEVLNNVEVQKGNIPENWGSADAPNADWVTTKTIVDPATGAETTVPTTPGTHVVTVRVTNNQGRYKDVPVTVVIPAPQKDGLTPAYAENVVAPGDSATTPPTFTNADGQSATAPTGATYAIPSSYTPPTGYTATIDPSTGAVTLTAPTGATVETVEVPVIVTYADNTTDSTSAVFKLDTDGDGQPDVTDTDDDNDGIPDGQDNNPKTPATSAVTVDDATVVAGQPIPAIPVTVTTDDTQATVAVKDLPAGLTYNPTTKQIEGTPTGAEIPEGQDSTTVTVTATVTDVTGTPVSDTAVITIQRDTDGDGQPDVTDTDDDNDGIPDGQDANSKTATKTTVSVDDATVVAGKEITPIPVTVTTDDTKATVEVTDLPAGLTYNPTTKQIEGTPTGAEIPEGQDSTTVTVTATVTDATGTPVSDTAVITIQRDTDGDGQPDVTDPDDDNDGIPDTQDANPKDANTSAVTVDDATVVAGQPITPISVAVTTDDTQATVEVTGLPAGLTYNPTTKQIEGTPTGAEIPAGQDETTVTVTATVTDATGTPVTDKAVITIQRDTDGDGQPDVTDPDDDNDGIPDTQDANPKDANTSAVTVDDAIVVAGQPITPIPVTVTTDDTQATVEVTGLPAGLTYNPTTKQIEGTPTGAEIPAGQDETTVTVTATVTDAIGTPVTDTAVITIQRDTDGDGQPDVTDKDDDNDGIPDDVEKQNGTDPKTPNTDTTVTPATVVEGQPVPDTTVVTPESPNTVITPSAPVNGISVDENGKLTGTPDITDWKDDEETREITIPVTVTTDGVEKVVEVPVTIQRDTDGDGQPDVTDTDDDND
ncbi:TPA: YPDG domain-containing protein, partial [Streptococcus suis]